MVPLEASVWFRSRKTQFVHKYCHSRWFGITNWGENGEGLRVSWWFIVILRTNFVEIIQKAPIIAQQFYFIFRQNPFGTEHPALFLWKLLSMMFSGPFLHPKFCLTIEASLFRAVYPFKNVELLDQDDQFHKLITIHNNSTLGSAVVCDDQVVVLLLVFRWCCCYHILHRSPLQRRPQALLCSATPYTHLCSLAAKIVQQ